MTDPGLVARELAMRLANHIRDAHQLAAHFETAPRGPRTEVEVGARLGSASAETRATPAAMKSEYRRLEHEIDNWHFHHDALARFVDSQAHAPLADRMRWVAELRTLTNLYGHLIAAANRLFDATQGRRR